MGKFFKRSNNTYQFWFCPAYFFSSMALAVYFTRAKHIRVSMYMYVCMYSESRRLAGYWNIGNNLWIWCRILTEGIRCHAQYVPLPYRQFLEFVIFKMCLHIWIFQTRVFLLLQYLTNSKKSMYIYTIFV